MATPKKIGRVKFPTEVFPPEIQNFITVAAKIIKCPEDFLGCLALPALGACVGLKKGIHVQGSWIDYGLLWSAVVAESGEKKTPAFNAIVKPIMDEQIRLHKEFKKEFAKYQNLKAAAKKGDPLPAPPRTTQHVTGDTTIEALKTVLVDNPMGVLLAVDELAGWVNSMSQYKGGRGDDRQNWLKIWSLQSLLVNRVGQPLTAVEKPFVGVLGTIQPGILGRILSTTDVDDGFAPRILLSFPEDYANKEWVWEEPPVANAKSPYEEAATVWNSVCMSLLNQPQTGTLVSLSAPARKVWKSWHDENAGNIESGYLRSVCSKAPGHCIRIALILHMAEWACSRKKGMKKDLPAVSDSLSAKTLKGAIKIVEYFKAHAKYAFDHVSEMRHTRGVTQGLTESERFKAWLEKAAETSARKALSDKVCGISTSVEARELFQRMATQGYGMVEQRGKKSVWFIPVGKVASVA